MLQQVVGRISLQGFTNGTTTFQCNGSPQTSFLVVAPFASSEGGTLRFHSGPAVGQAFAEADFFDQFGDFLGFANATFGPSVVRIVG